MKKTLLAAAAFFFCLTLCAQSERTEVRKGNAKFRNGKYREAEIDYRKAVLNDSTSLAANYNLASSLYEQGNYDGAGQVLSGASELHQGSGYSDRYHFNSGNVALQKKDYQSAVREFREALLENPADLDAKESYVYAKQMLQNRQNQQQQDNKDNNDNKDKEDRQQNQQQQDQQQQPQQQPEDGKSQPQEQKISPQQAQQMLNAVQAKEKETQEKVKKEKAAAAGSVNREKNW